MIMSVGLAVPPALAGTLMNVSEEKRTPAAGNWTMSQYAEGQDPEWDRLGADWFAVDGVIEDARIYAAWTDTEDGRSYLSGLHVAGTPITADLLRSIPVGRLENLPHQHMAGTVARFVEMMDELGPLRREKGEEPAAFAERVAEYYRVFSAFTSKPAKMISDQYGIPLPTVHGWIREARLQGKLPPGKRGKAG